jgi:molecular chaperone HscB
VSDPFEILGVAKSFDLDPASLEQRYRELCRALHPDRYVGSPAGERRAALSRAVDVNAAFRMLRDPARRAEALLALNGHGAEGVESARAAPALLMEVMERREALGEARRGRDLQKLRALRDEVRKRQQQAIAGLTQAFAAVPPDLTNAERLLGELRYHQRFLEEAGSAEDELDTAGNP